MEPFEKELRDALRRENPSANFEDRIADRVARVSRGRAWWPPRLAWPQLRWAAVGTLCLLTLGGIAYRREQEVRRAEGETAKRQVMLALRIAGAEMNLARTKVRSLSHENGVKR